MLKRGISLSLAAFVLHAGISFALATPQSDAARQTAKVKQEVTKRGVGEKAKVRVKLKNKTEIKGYISQAAEDSFTVTDSKSGQPHTIAYADVVQIKGKGLSKGAKIAIWTGVAVVATVAVVAIIVSREHIELGRIFP